MIVFPHAKINLGLNILSRRDDGYHEIETCLYPIPWKDILEIIPGTKMKFTCSGLEIPGGSGSNLCLSAYQLMKDAYDLPPVQIHLHKVIPIGAGLGGGSADGAFTLSLLNTLFDLGISERKLRDFASQLGSDCPFFIPGKPTLATGTGTVLTPLPLDLKGLYLLLCYPGIHVGTKEAYENTYPVVPETPIREILLRPVREWKDSLINDFETSVFRNHPQLRKIKEELYAKGALYAAMSGSGSTIYGLFDHEVKAEGYIGWWL